MERKEQMYKDWEEKISNSYNTEFDDICFSAFLDGAKWADANPQLSKGEFIDKACEWLRNNIDFYVETKYDEDFRVDIEQLSKDIRKAMEE